MSAIQSRDGNWCHIRKRNGAMSMSAWWIIGINICVAFVVVLSTIAMLKPMMT